MTLIIGDNQNAQTGPAGEDPVKDGTDASFMADVVEASRETPVIVDFWAPWCGPCKQLGPVLERVVRAAKGAVKLVKIDTDRHPAYAGQLRVQSIPAVYAFKDGQPVDGFMGALPESQVKAFVDKLIGGADAGKALEEALGAAAEAFGAGDIPQAAQVYAQVLQAQPDNPKAIAGLARCYLAGGDAAKAEEILAMAPADARDADLDGARAAVRLSQSAPDELAPLTAEAETGDFAARLAYARALAGHGRHAEAMDQLFGIIEADRDWNEGEARKFLLEVFDAAGGASEATKSGRRRLSSILFS